MSDIHSTPMEYGLRVRMHPSGMLITGLNKMRNGTPMRVSFNGTLNETILFDLDPQRLASNLAASTRLLESLAATGKTPEVGRGAAKIWRGLYPDDVIEFLEQYKTHPEAKRVDSTMIAKFIRRRFSQGELNSWTVGIVSNEETDSPKIPLPGFPDGVGLYKRSSMEAQQYPGAAMPGAPLSKYTIRRLVSPNNEAADLTPEQYAAALNATKQAALRKNPDKPEPTYALGPQIRAERGSKHGLLLLYPLDPKHLNEDKAIFLNVDQKVIMGFAISFPSNTAYPNDGLDYMVNYVYTAIQDFDLE
jgi:hypothetical protein